MQWTSNFRYPDWKLYLLANCVTITLRDHSIHAFRILNFSLKLFFNKSGFNLNRNSTKGENREIRFEAVNHIVHFLALSLTRTHPDTHI